jgi:type IV secretion system protein VirB2
MHYAAMIGNAPKFRTAAIWLFFGSLMAWLLFFHPAYASEATTGLEWETPFQAFYKSITGPVAFGIAFLGIVVCGAILIWGGEINEFVRRMVMVILVVAVIMFAGNILRRMFAGGAATIPAVTVVQPPYSVSPAVADNMRAASAL